MKAIYAKYLQAWRDGGGEVFVHYLDCQATSKWGRWGALEYLDQPRAEAPKHDALMEFIAANPIGW
jgi:hypothetical protein